MTLSPRHTEEAKEISSKFNGDWADTEDQIAQSLAAAEQRGRREGASAERVRCLKEAERWHRDASLGTGKEMSGEYVARRIVGSIRGYETTGG